MLYLTTAAEPEVSGADAVLQEISALRTRFGGEVVNLYPFGKHVFRFPRLFYGLPALPRLAAALRRHEIVHLYHAAPYGFPVTRLAKRPVIFTVTAGLGPDLKRGDRGALDRVRAVVVCDEREQEILRGRGHESVEVVRPAIETQAFDCTPRPPAGTVRILFGSSPWTKGQFLSKGVAAALDAARRDPSLEITFLWRGLLTEKLQRAADTRGVSSRIRIINCRADVNKVLGTVSATAAIVRDPAEIRAYPHSLMESLAAGKPVIVSRNIPMARFVRDRECGVITDGAEEEHILAALGELRSRYAPLQKRALDAGKEFSLTKMIRSYENLYNTYSG